jgi:hypothetical protein
MGLGIHQGTFPCLLLGLKTLVVNHNAAYRKTGHGANPKAGCVAPHKLMSGRLKLAAACINPVSPLITKAACCYYFESFNNGCSSAVIFGTTT